MSDIGEIAVPASAVAMHETLAAAPEVTVELERVVAHETGTLTPHLWVRGVTGSSSRPAWPRIRPSPRRPRSTSTTRRRSTGRGVAAAVDSVGAANLQTGATVLEATGGHEGWELRLRFESRQGVSEFYEYCTDHGIYLR